ncbi:MAG TPA: hypothetical protein VFX98_03770, partial [Longimicrobiaceae bacterium]|nr:hypothetical protein [Longimicrobiaceae bacterium]
RVVGGRGTRNAVIDPRTLGYQEAPVQFATQPWAQPLFDAADAAAWTALDLRPLRALASAGQLGTLPPGLLPVIYGFDAVVILSGSGPSRQFER